MSAIDWWVDCYCSVRFVTENHAVLEMSTRPVTAEEEYERNSSLKKEDIADLRSWMRSQPHLPIVNGQYNPKLSAIQALLRIILVRWSRCKRVLIPYNLKTYFYKFNNIIWRVVLPFYLMVSIFVSLHYYLSKLFLTVTPKKAIIDIYIGAV